jgi:hypothetical protein
MMIAPPSKLPFSEQRWVLCRFTGLMGSNSVSSGWWVFFPFHRFDGFYAFSSVWWVFSVSSVWWVLRRFNRW